ncbi:MAG TPA: DUF427 domain-containing protein [Acidimicrobiales bacterium]|nr:DUF427 domain-containing protein [Acidimicrobiales bacterium]
MTVRAVWNGTTIAESDATVLVEGNHYFPPADVRSDLLVRSATSTHCPWKGDASYYDVVVGTTTNSDAAWYYPEPFPAAEGARDHVAFWKGVEVTGSNEGEPEIRPPARA